MASSKTKVLLAGAELAPLAKVGGLGDVMGALPKALARLGLNVKVIIPYYGFINKRKYKAKLWKKGISTTIEDKAVKFDLYKTKLPGSSVEVWLVKHKMFDYNKIYLGKRKYFKGKGRVYSREPSDVERFVFFSKTIVESIKATKWIPDVLHCHDWHLALTPTFIDEYNISDNKFDNITTLFTIHNLANQGITGLDIVDYAGLHHDLTPALMEDYYDKDGEVIDLMKIGILSADYVNTVSPNYAKEILTKEYGEGLEEYLKRRQNHLTGILNGIDWQMFDPSHDKHLKKTYNLKTYKKAKPINREFLQKRAKLAIRDDVPILGLVSRLVKQKGLDILVPALERLLKTTDMQVVVLGTGQPEYEEALKKLQKKYKDKVKAFIEFDIKLAQQIYAGSDFFLMPSLFEPCGLGQMIAMRYGTIPIARKTGGLKDTVIHNKQGVVFSKYTIADMTKALKQSVSLYKHKAKFNKIIVNGMKQDHSWEKSAKTYCALYKKLS